MPSIAQVEPMTTARALRGPFDYRLPEELSGSGSGVGVGSMLVVPFGHRQVLGVVVGMADSSEIATEKLLAPLRALELGVPAEMVALAEWIAAEYCSTLARALALVLPPGATRRLSGRKRRAVKRTTHVGVGARAPQSLVLNEDQRVALASLQQALQRRTAHARLLHGVTGSGKTEVYLQAAETALEQGRGVIVLVPEIALTPQTVGRFIERFGDTVAVLHSQLRPGERYAEWRRLREGEARICVGPRSAVFAPIEDLGLIVLDEEHESSYKHEGDPRYDARDVAAERTRRSGAVLLLGSATPRAESEHRVRSSLLPRRVDGRPLPGVEVLDMRGETRGLHPTTTQALARVRDARAKAIVLLNRRGWSNFLSCRSCGNVWSCPSCDVALVLHRAGGFLACHHCGHREPAPERCGACSSMSVARHGAGTERLQHELAAVLDDGSFPIFRLDADVAAGAGTPTPTAAGGASATGDGPEAAEESAVGALLRRFEAADCGVLIGTQMVAKGHDFPDVALGVVLDADATLRFPDFRADERTFALIAQLAGRVGRGGEGRVLVQTIAPQARAIEHAARHDSEGFLRGELQRREALGYPPYSHLVRVVCSAERPEPARAAALAIRQALASRPPQDDDGAQMTVLGPAALFRLRGRERESLVVKAGERRPAVAAIDEAVRRVAAAREHRGVHFSVDVDPQ
ncbi:MAG TPA: primosomal protein N' [Solirubrobacteraceae bacterium]|jgi:primosomal protein N' (replication factor Y)|nr:primosomal protein N' [Solirubrobacteraceae bacterium]